MKQHPCSSINQNKMAKRTKKNAALRLEALEQRQLLAGVTGAGTEVGTDIHHPNGNVYDQVLLQGGAVAVTADAGQITRVSFLDMQGDIVQAEFFGKGTLTVAMADGYSTGVAPANYNQSGVTYVQGLASFTITGADATTNFSVFSVGEGTPNVNTSLFDATHKGGDHWANVQRITVVADTANPNGSTFGGIRAGNAIFSSDSGVTGITAADVQVQNVVRIGDVDAKGTATPALTFGTSSQFGSVEVAGGDLAQTNGKAINNSGSYGYQITTIANTDSSGAAIPAGTISSTTTFTDKNPLTSNSKTFELTSGIDAFAGTAGNDKFVGTTATALSALDDLNGDAGTDTLSLAATGAIAIPSSAKVSNIETAVVTSGADVSGDFSTWTGLTNLTVVSNAGTTAEIVTAGSADLTLSNTAVLAAGGTGGTITVNGGKTDTIVNTITNTGAVNTTATGGGITVAGTAATTSISVTQTAPVTADATHVGITDGGVTITGNGTSLATVSLKNYANSTIDSKGLSTLTVSGKGGTLGIANNTMTALNLTADSADVGNITDSAGKYATVNITSTGSGSSKTRTSRIPQPRL